METIIKKACKGGYIYYNLDSYKTPEKQADFLLTDYDSPSEYELVCDPLFWQSLGKACGWDKDNMFYNENGCYKLISWRRVSLKFHEINLTEGWDKAVEYLQEITK